MLWYRVPVFCCIDLRPHKVVVCLCWPFGQYFLILLCACMSWFVLVYEFDKIRKSKIWQASDITVFWTTQCICVLCWLQDIDGNIDLGCLFYCRVSTVFSIYSLSRL